MVYTPHTESPTEVRRAIQRMSIDSDALDTRLDVWEASPAFSITAIQVANWDTAYGWGDHAGLYDAVGTAAGLVGAHELAYDHDNYDTAYGWGDHSAAGYADSSDLAATTQGATCGATLVGCPTVSGATVNTAWGMANSFGSAGRRSGGAITDAGGATVNVAAGTGFIKATDDDTAELISFNWPAVSGIAIPTDTLRYIGVEWNGGTPRVTTRTSFNFDKDTDFPLGEVANENDTLVILNNPWWVTDGITNIIQRFCALGYVSRCAAVGGLILGTSGTRNITVNAGTLWSRFNSFAISDIDTSAAGDFTLYYKDNANNWHNNTAETQYPVTQWNDVTKAPGAELVTMGANKYANWWVYLLTNGHVALVYPQAEYTNVALAEAASPPTSIPDLVHEFGLLIGRIIFQKSVDAPVEVQSAFTTTFTAALAADHGNLSGLSDDDHAHYHNDARAVIWLAAGHETTYNHANYNTAYGWGNHAGAGYAVASGLTSTYMVYANASGQAAGTAKMTFNGTHFTLASGSYLKSADIFVCEPFTDKAFQLSSGGNARGANAIDMQAGRTADTQVASGSRAAIISGYENTVSANSSTVASGRQNSIVAGSSYQTYSCIASGYQNQVQGYASAILGGSGNTILLAAGVQSSAIVGGYGNSITGDYDTICGGYQNSVAYNYNTICGGRGNTIPADAVGRNTICGGYLNIIVAASTNNGYNVIGSGRSNSLQGQYSAILGGYTNTIALAAGAQYASICGGRSNDIGAHYGTICGGYLNTIVASTNSYTTIVGGYSNTTVAGSTYNGCNVLGGYDNSAQGSYCVVAGGRENDIALAAGAIGSAIGGGYLHNVAGNYATIPGGRENVADGDNSLASGFNAKATRYGQHTQASGKLVDIGDAQTSVLTQRNQTSDATATELFLDGIGTRLSIPANTSWTYRYSLIGRCTSGTATVPVYGADGWGVIDRDGSNTTTLVHNVDAQSETSAQHTVTADNTNEALVFTVTGEASCYFSWVVRIELVEVTGTGTAQQGSVGSAPSDPGGE